MATATLEKRDIAGLPPGEIRGLIRKGLWTDRTEGLAGGYVQANLVILPRRDAFDFLLFCQRNPKPCPVIEVTDVGSPILKSMAPGADLRTDLPKYSVYQKGERIDDVTDITGYWRDDLVGFLIGCSFSYAGAMRKAGIPLKPSSLYSTKVPCVSAGRFAGPWLVTMRMVPPENLVRVVQITSRYPFAHGAPVHIGDPRELGVDVGADLNDAKYHIDRNMDDPSDVPVFWACGCTPQAVALESKTDFMISHYSACCFITDKRADEISTL